MNQFIKNNLFSLLMLIGTPIGIYVWELTKAGGQVELNNKIDTRVTRLMQNPILINQFLDQKEVKNFAKEQRREAKEEAAREDSKNTKFRVLCGIEMGVRNEDTYVEIGKMYKTHLIIKNIIDSIVDFKIKPYVKPRRRTEVPM